MTAITIDGPSGAGKSTIAKKLANRLDMSIWIPVQCTVISHFI